MLSSAKLSVVVLITVSLARWLHQSWVIPAAFIYICSDLNNINNVLVFKQDRCCQGILKGASITVLLTSSLTILESAV